MYVLSVVAAIFLPLGFLTGLLGIYAVCTVSCWHRCRADAVVQAKKNGSKFGDSYLIIGFRPL
jgi:hypothetical protein